MTGLFQFTFDDRVDAYRRNIARELKKTEKREVAKIVHEDGDEKN